jgi:hypothetical protein
MKKTTFSKALPCGIIFLFLSTAFFFPVQSSFVNVKEEYNPNISAITKAVDDTNRFDPINRPYFLMFNSYLDIDYDSSKLSEPIPINGAVAVPITIQYQTNIPETFLWWLPFWRIRNLILYGSIIGPMQTIHLEATNIPEWATIYITQPDVWIVIPHSGTVSETTTTLVIAPKEGAPNQYYSLNLKASCEDVGRIKGSEHNCIVNFEPMYDPCLNVNALQFTECPQNQSTVIIINVTNCGNKKSEVTGEIMETPDGFQLTLLPDYEYIDICETKPFYIKVKPSDDFIGDEIIPIRFIAKRFPLQQDAPIGGAMLYLVVRVI